MLQLNREDGWSIMGVFDGHGNWGGRVATAVRDSMMSAMKKVDGCKMNGSDPEMVQFLALTAQASLRAAGIEVSM